MKPSEQRTFVGRYASPSTIRVLHKIETNTKNENVMQFLLNELDFIVTTTFLLAPHLNEH
ncbi:hypothetical protein BLOT_008125 [Blomia tropicalis]|nr:hypothetical protein BLOT_008125 [Blomia tropicalis]